MHVLIQLALCRIVECTFGMTKEKFPILLFNRHFSDRERFLKLVTTLCALHNYILRAEGSTVSREQVQARGRDETVLVPPAELRGAPRTDASAFDQDGQREQELLGQHLVACRDLPAQIVEECCMRHWADV